MESQSPEPEALRVQLLGRFQVCIGSQRVPDEAWRLRKAAAIVKLLALSRGHRLHREHLLDTLWPDLSPDAAANNLRYALHTARRALSPGPFLQLTADHVELSASVPVRVDVEEFESAAAAARVTRDPAAYRAAIELYGGQLLPEDLYEDWTEPVRERLRSVYLGLLHELATVYHKQGEDILAMESLERLITEDPLHEEAHQMLMSLQVAAGQRHRALRQYEQLAAVLERELGSEPDESARRLYKQILASSSDTQRTLANLAPVVPFGPSSNLPELLTSFVGRDRELAHVRSLLTSHRLVTLTGVGGAGKTRLGLAVARAVEGEYSGGVTLVELASLTDPALLPRHVAGAFGFQREGDVDMVVGLAAGLRNTQVLLILDNCEHLIEPCARLVERLLQACPNLRVLATSREGLDLPGEVTFPVPPLRVPEAAEGMAVELVGQFEAIRLFVERARERRPDFELTSKNVHHVDEICRRLAGIPLAIELAAGRVGVLSVEQISRKIDDALDLLSQGHRTAAARQRTLRGTLDWSYDLLEEPEKRLFRELSVFAGGWTLSAAEQVYAAGDADRAETLHLLGLLAQKSLVQVDLEGGDARYRLLEVVRQYAREQLAPAEADVLRRSHAAYYFGLAARLEQVSNGPREAEWLDLLEADHDNLRAGLSWGLEHEPGLALQAACRAARLWAERGYLREGTDWLNAALDAANPDPQWHARALSELGTLQWHLGDYAAAERFHARSLELYESLNDEQWVAVCLNNLGVQANQQQQYARAQELFQQSVQVAGVSGSRLAMKMALHNMATLVLEQGEYEHARELFGQCLELCREDGDESVLRVVLHNLSEAAYHEQEYEQALQLSLESLAISARVRRGVEICFCLEEAAGAYAGLGQVEKAVRLLGAASLIREATGQSLHPRYRATYYDPLLAKLSGALPHHAVEALWAEGRRMQVEGAVEYAMDRSKSAREPEAPRLTAREQEVLRALAGGGTNNEIARLLHVSPRTVDTHIHNILGKLGLRSRQEALDWLSMHPVA